MFGKVTFTGLPFSSKLPNLGGGIISDGSKQSLVLGESMKEVTRFVYTGFSAPNFLSLAIRVQVTVILSEHGHQVLEKAF